MAFRIGTAPINWNNADIPDWRPETPYPRILDEIAAAGYTGTELGDNFPRDPRALRRDLDARGLTLLSYYNAAPFADPARRAQDIDATMASAEFLAGMGCSLYVVSPLGPERRKALAGHTAPDGSDSFSPEGWRYLAGCLHEIADRLRPLGLTLVVHNEAGTAVETRAEIDQICAHTDPERVSLCLDSGHLAYGGDDPVEAIRAHIDRIRYVHIKDVDPHVLAGVRTDRVDFIEALRRVVFCEIGRGCADAAGVLRTLAELGYDGWVVVEQDTSNGDPSASARESRAFIRQTIGY